MQPHAARTEQQSAIVVELRPGSRCAQRERARIRARRDDDVVFEAPARAVERDVDPCVQVRHTNATERRLVSFAVHTDVPADVVNARWLRIECFDPCVRARIDEGKCPLRDRRLVRRRAPCKHKARSVDRDALASRATDPLFAAIRGVGPTREDERQPTIRALCHGACSSRRRIARDDVRWQLLARCKGCGECQRGNDEMRSHDD